jgi:hypothetical protein
MSRLARRQFLSTTGGFLAAQATAVCRAGEAATEVASTPPAVKKPAPYGDAVLVDGVELWRPLVSRHKNFILAMNGHVLGDGLGRLVSPAHGSDISRQLVNFEIRPNGGDGWLRLIEMRPDGTAQTYDYSTTRGQRDESPQNQFMFSVPQPS